MDKDIEKSINLVLKIKEKQDKNDTNKLKVMIEEAFEKPAKISVKKEANGKAELNVEGSYLTILITLAGLEKSILDNFNTLDVLWEVIKDVVGTEEDKNNE